MQHDDVLLEQRLRCLLEERNLFPTKRRFSWRTAGLVVAAGFLGACAQYSPALLQACVDYFT